MKEEWREKVISDLEGKNSKVGFKKNSNGISFYIIGNLHFFPRLVTAKIICELKNEKKNYKFNSLAKNVLLFVKLSRLLVNVHYNFLLQGSK